MRILIIVIMLFSAITGSAQEDSTYQIKYKNTSYFGLHSDVGWNKSFFASLGVCYLEANANSHSGASHVVIYSAAEINLAGYTNPAGVFYGYKGGIEWGSNLLMMGMELRGYTDFKGREHTVFMPKAGFSVFGYMNIAYGYNVFQNKFNVFGIGHHQIAASVNLSRKLFKESFVPR